MKTYASLFTGGGLADWGARAAGLTPVWGVELDAQIAAVAQQNDPSGTIYAASVLDVDYSALTRVDVLHASPPCPNFSVAKTGGVETPLDLALADAVCRAINAQRPELFTLENVRGYAGSESLTRIQATLLDLDYHVTTVVLNAADYGVPQTRERLFLIAHAGGWMQSQRPLPSKTPWRGWYQAIEDLIPTLPESAFAPWQLARLPEELQGCALSPTNAQEFGKGHRVTDEPSFTLASDCAKARAFILSNSATEYGNGRRDADEPMLAVTGQTAGRARAFLMRGANSQQEWGDGMPHPIAPAYSVTTDSPPRAFLMMSNRSGIEGATVGQGDALPHEPANTVATRITSDARAWLVNEDSKMGIVADDEPAFTQVSAARALRSRAWLASGRVVAMTPRALARFQSVPDTYQLPDKKALACRIIGNGVAVEAYAALLRSQLCS